MTNCEEFISQLANKYGRKRESLLPIVHEVINQYYFLSEESMTAISSELNIPTAELYGTATFYSFFDTKPQGKYIIRICQTIVCDMKRKEDIVDAIYEMLRIRPGETTNDGKFTLYFTNCLGMCHEGPAMLINDEQYSKLTPEKVKDILVNYMKR